jgi:hypothetical protein
MNGEQQSHDAQKTLTDLRDHLARHDKPIAFLFGAGTSCSVSVPDGGAGAKKPLIPAVPGLTAACKKDGADLGEKYAKAWASMEAQCVEAKQDPHVENILSRLRMMLNAIGKDDTLSGLKMDELEKLEECVRKTIARLVTPDLMGLPADFPHRKFARWLAKTSRKACVEIFTVNYDVLIEHALESERVPVFDGFVGSYRPFFLADSLRRAEAAPGAHWTRLWKMHGSVTWRRIEQDGRARVVRGEPDMAGEMILPSFQKYDESRQQPYAAAKLQIDRVEIRRRNLIAPEELPLDRNVSTCLGARRIVYDEGDYPKCFEMAVAEIDYESIKRKRHTAATRGKYLGIGYSNHVEQTAIGPYEDARVSLDLGGKLTVFSPVVAMGQGTEITLRQIAADEIGFDIGAIEIRFGNTDELPDAIGAFASRGAAIGGSAVRQATRAAKETMLDRLASQMNCRRDELRWESGGIVGPSITDGPLSIEAALARLQLASTSPIEGKFRLENIEASYSYAAHIALVEIDMETFKISVPQYVVAHDCGTVINPLLVEGQIVGGVVQGLGGMLREHLQYDENGRLNARGLMDYVLPGIGDLPQDFRILHMETPSTIAQFGVRGVGEGGVTGCYGAIATAVADALRTTGANIRGSGPYLPAMLYSLAHN